MYDSNRCNERENSSNAAVLNESILGKDLEDKGSEILQPICVRLPRDVYKKLKIHCVEKEKTMKDVISNFIKGLKLDFATFSSLAQAA